MSDDTHERSSSVLYQSADGGLVNGLAIDEERLNFPLGAGHTGDFDTDSDASATSAREGGASK